MKMEKDGITLTELSEGDKAFQTYYRFLRNYDNIKMIGRYEYLLSIDPKEIQEYLEKVNRSPNDSFFGVWVGGGRRRIHRHA